jgi:hypothetical protein
MQAADHAVEALSLAREKFVDLPEIRHGMKPTASQAVAMQLKAITRPIIATYDELAAAIRV